MEEIDTWVEESRKIKMHPLAELNVPRFKKIMDIANRDPRNTIPTRHRSINYSFEQSFVFGVLD